MRPGGRKQDVGEEAVDSLGELRDKRAVEARVAALEDQDGGVRWAAVNALGEIKDAKAIGPLLRTLNDQARYVREGAALA